MISAAKEFEKWARSPLFTGRDSSIPTPHTAAIALLKSLGIDASNVVRVAFESDVTEIIGHVTVERLVPTDETDGLQRVKTRYAISDLTVSAEAPTTVLEREVSQRVRFFECWLRNMARQAV